MSTELSTYPIEGNMTRLVMRTMMRSTELGASTKVIFRVMNQPVRWDRTITTHTQGKSVETLHPRHTALSAKPWLIAVHTGKRGTKHCILGLIIMVKHFQQIFPVKTTLLIYIVFNLCGPSGIKPTTLRSSQQRKRHRECFNGEIRRVVLLTWQREEGEDPQWKNTEVSEGQVHPNHIHQDHFRDVRGPEHHEAELSKV